MTIELVRIPLDKFEAFVYDALRALGMSNEEADYCGRGVIQSHIRCLPGQGQGISKLLQYQERISKGWIKLGAPVSIVKESPSLALIDGGNGLGSMIGQSPVIRVIV